MSLSFILKTLFELFLVVAVFWCIFHEDTLISFERRVIALFRRKRLRVVKYNTHKMIENI